MKISLSGICGLPALAGNRENETFGLWKEINDAAAYKKTYKSRCDDESELISYTRVMFRPCFLLFSAHLLLSGKQYQKRE